MTLEIKQTDKGLIIKVKVVPGSSRNRIGGLLDGALKINITAAPEKGKANKRLVQFLAEILALPKSSLTILTGQRDNHKQVQIVGLSCEKLMEHLEQFI